MKNHSALLNLRNVLILALVAGLSAATSGCLWRRRVIVVPEPYPAPVVVPQAAPAAPTITAPETPPAPKVETPPPAPSTSYVWTEGYWVWERGWRWRSGVWVVRPRPLAVWVPGHWVREPRAWVWMPGHWQ
jgi:hypothetical protein